MSLKAYTQGVLGTMLSRVPDMYTILTLFQDNISMQFQVQNLFGQI